MNDCPLWSPQDVVERFLDALGSGDAEIAARLLHTDVQYRPAVRPPLRGRAAVRRRFRGRVTVYAALVDVAPRAARANSDDGAVTAERISRVGFGPFRMDVRVTSRFEVRAGRIVTWGDQCDPIDALRALTGAVVGVARAPSRFGGALSDGYYR